MLAGIGDLGWGIGDGMGDREVGNGSGDRGLGNGGKGSDIGDQTSGIREREAGIEVWEMGDRDQRSGIGQREAGIGDLEF